MPKITNEKKLEVIKGFLRENNIPFEENHASKRCGVNIPLAVKMHRIAIRIGDSQNFYLATKGKYHPIFIRDEDTKAKVLEKIQNTIIKSMKIKQNSYLKNVRHESREMHHQEQ